MNVQHHRAPRASRVRALSLPLATTLCVPLLALAGIASTKHNLTGTDAGPVMNVCVFCHTPAGDPNVAAAPTWSATSDQDGTTFTTFDDLGRLDPNRDGVSGTVSVACMSCHDDTQAVGISSLAYDHPVGVAYRGAVVSGIDLDNLPARSTDASGQITFIAGSDNAPERRAISNLFDVSFRRATSGVIDGQTAYWVETGTDGRQRTDIKLYSRYFGETTSVPFIECASCHDPHSDTETFLRVDNRGSALCLGCHDI